MQHRRAQRLDQHDGNWGEQGRVSRLVALSHLVVSQRPTVVGRQGANAYDLQPLLAQASALDAQDACASDGWR